VTSRHRSLWPRSYWAQLLVVAAAYAITAKLSLRIALVGGVVTPIWPPTGIAVVALLLGGRRLWPAITVGALVVNVPINDTLFGAGLIAAGNTIAPLVAVAILHLAEFRRELDTLRDAIAVVLAGIVAMTISASLGAAALLIEGTISRHAFAGTWATWWAGDATGVLVFAPFLLSLRWPPLRSWAQWLEAVVVLGVLAGVSYVVYRDSFADAYIVFPLLMWAAIRLGQEGASASGVVVVAMAVWAAVDGVGPFGHGSLLRKMLTLQVFDAVVALTAFVVAAVMTERKLALENLEHGLAREHRITETLQRSLLPDRLPEIPGVAFAGRYLPGAAGLEVGGDWYDVFLLPGGRIGLTIGDVVGRGLGAAAAMGQLRTAVRAYALETSSPAAVIERLSRLVQDFEAAQMATLVYGVLDLDSGRFAFASAGHPPPLLVGPGYDARYLEGGRSLPLGVASSVAHDEIVIVEPGSTLLLYTDGLIESRQGSITDTMEELRGAVASFAGDLDALCDERVLAAPRPAAPDDDVALLAVRVLPVDADRLRLTFPAEPHVMSFVRRAVGQWLRRNGATAEETNDIVLACSEAATNVLEHAYGPAGGTFDVEADNVDGEIVIVVRDRGQWRAPRGDERGRGVPLMHAMIDRVDVEHGPDGTEVRLRRQLGGPPRTEPTRHPGYPATGVDARIAVVQLTGDVDLQRAAAVYDELTGAVGNDALGLVVDLSAVRHLDSAGIRVLYRVAVRLEPRRQHLRVVVPTDSPIRRVMTIADMGAYIPLATTVDEAVADLRTLNGNAVDLDPASQ